MPPSITCRELHHLPSTSKHVQYTTCNYVIMHKVIYLPQALLVVFYPHTQLMYIAMQQVQVHSVHAEKQILGTPFCTA